MVQTEPKEESPTETPRSDELLSAFSPALDTTNHLSPSQDCSLDLLRIVKHKPSAIVFSDFDCSTEEQENFACGSSDDGESPLSTTEGEGDSDEDDDFPKTLQYKEFLVSHHRRNLSRNRKCLRKRQDAQPDNSACSWQRPTSEGKPEFTGSQEEEDATKNNGPQVRKTREQRTTVAVVHLEKTNVWLHACVELQFFTLFYEVILIYIYIYITVTASMQNIIKYVIYT